MKVLVDAQLPPAAADWLRARGHDAIHLNDIGMKDAADTDVWSLAIEQERVILSKDRDFADRYVSGQRPAPLIVWIRTGNLSRSQQIDHLARNWIRILTRLSRNTPITEVW